MEIKQFEKNDESRLFNLLLDEGDEWIDYYGAEGRSNYINALATSITYLALDEGLVIGYVRCRQDNGFGVYIYDLLVKKSHRGQEIVKTLMERVYKNFPDQTIYVMSDVDTYYEKLGYQRKGSIFEVKIFE